MSSSRRRRRVYRTPTGHVVRPSDADVATVPCCHALSRPAVAPRFFRVLFRCSPFSFEVFGKRLYSFVFRFPQYAPRPYCSMVHNTVPQYSVSFSFKYQWNISCRAVVSGSRESVKRQRKNGDRCKKKKKS